MIDIENIIFDGICTEVERVHGEVYASSEYVPAPPFFPAISVTEMSNTEHLRSVDSSNREKFANVSYEVNTYSNLESGAKSQAKAIAATIRDWMKEQGFTCNYFSSVPNSADTTVKRYLCRFTGVAQEAIDGTNNIYGR